MSSMYSMRQQNLLSLYRKCNAGNESPTARIIFSAPAQQIGNAGMSTADALYVLWQQNTRQKVMLNYE